MFCKDFDFYAEGKLSREDIVEIFKRNAKFTKDAYLEDFEKIVFKMTEKLFKESSNLCEKVYDILSFEDQNGVKSKLKLGHLPFNSKIQRKKIEY